MGTLRVVGAAWRRFPLVAATIVAATGISAVGSSLTNEERWAASSSLNLQRVPADEAIRAELDRRAAVIARELAFRPAPPQPRLVARPGNPVVEVTVEAPRPTYLVFFANMFAAELVAWERGPEQRAVQRRYWRTLKAVDQAQPGAAGLEELKRELRRLEQQKITDSHYRKAVEARRLDGPAPFRDGALGLCLGVLLASTVVLLLGRIGATPAGAGSASHVG